MNEHRAEIMRLREALAQARAEYEEMLAVAQAALDQLKKENAELRALLEGTE